MFNNFHIGPFEYFMISTEDFKCKPGLKKLFNTVNAGNNSDKCFCLMFLYLRKQRFVNVLKCKNINVAKFFNYENNGKVANILKLTERIYK